MAVQGGASNNSVQSCTAACSASHYSLAGMEYSDECCTYSVAPHFLNPRQLTLLLKDCANSFSNGGAPTPPGDCSMTCSGNSSEFCGGPNRLNVYSLNSGTQSTTSSHAPSSSTAPSSSSSPSSTSSSSPSPTVVPNVGPWVSLGCYKYFHLPLSVGSGSLTLLCLPQ
jgi:hypothetical protein